MRYAICGLVAAGTMLLGCYDQDVVDREAADLGVSDEEIRAVVDDQLDAQLDARLDARLADYDGRLAALEQAVGLPYKGSTDLAARMDAVEDEVATLDPAELGARVQALEDAGFVVEETDPVATAAGYLTSYTETDPVASAAGYLTSYTETDPVASAAGYLTSYAETDPVATAAGYLTSYVETDPVASAAGYLTSYTETDPVATAAGYLTSYTETDPVATAAGYLTSYTETDPVASAAGYLTVETDPVATAAGYLTSFTETDPVAGAAGYLTSYTETDPVASAAGYLTSYTETDPVASAAGYLTSYTETDPVASAAGYLSADELDLCPVGYVHDPTETQFTLCYDPNSALAADEMVRVGDFWVDRHESSVWQNPDCSGTQYGATTTDDYPTGFPDNGNWTTPVYACSVPGVTPSRRITWFQSQQACSASGKSLCSNQQWQAAAGGTYDPGIFDGDGGGSCNTMSGGGFPRVTGAAGSTPASSTSCISAWGAEDMVGNLREQAGDWYVAGPDWVTGGGQDASPWPPGYGDDLTWNLNGWANSGIANENGLPAAAHRGGWYSRGDGAGVFSMYLTYGPSATSSSNGFRCCRGR